MGGVALLEGGLGEVRDVALGAGSGSARGGDSDAGGCSWCRGGDGGRRVRCGGEGDGAAGAERRRR